MNQKKVTTDRYIPRPTEGLGDALRGKNDQRSAPMAPDVETAFGLSKVMTIKIKTPKLK